MIRVMVDKYEISWVMRDGAINYVCGEKYEWKAVVEPCYK